MPTTTYANGTSLTTRGPWDTFHSARVMCSDHRLRTTKRIAPVADTWFSVPCAVSVQGRTVGGYLTLEEDGVSFRPYMWGSNHDALPD